MFEGELGIMRKFIEYSFTASAIVIIVISTVSFSFYVLLIAAAMKPKPMSPISMYNICPPDIPDCFTVPCTTNSFAPYCLPEVLQARTDLLDYGTGTRRAIASDNVRCSLEK